MEDSGVEWKVMAIRGATTAAANTALAIQEAVTELLDALESRNQLEPKSIVSATFSVTRDLDAIFPAAIARQRPGWDSVPLLDVQQMYVPTDLPRCIRFLIHVNLPPHTHVHHPYLKEAKNLRPDLSFAPASSNRT
ncbi:MAG: chorismate mutase [Oscillatoriaceae cyanobacterium]